MRRELLPATLAVIFLSTSSLRADDVTEQAIQALEAHYQHFERYTLKLDEKTIISNQQYNNEHAATYSMKLFRDTNRWAEAGYSELHLKPDGKWQRREREYLFDGTNAFILGWDDGQPPAGIAGWTEVTDPHVIYGPQYEFSFFTNGLGMYAGHNNLTSILRKSSVVMRREANGQLLVLEGTSRWGKYTVWLDPARGHAPVKLVIQKKQGDWIDENTPLESRETYQYGKSRRVSMEVVCTATKIEVQDGTHVMTEYTVEDRSQLNNGKSFSFTYRGTLSEINLSPNFTDADFSIKRPIPDGMRVSIQNEPQILYEWQDGQLMKAYEAEAVRAAEAARQLRGRWLTRSTIALTILAVVVAVLIVRHRRRQS